jgi:hypothetical protein
MAERVKNIGPKGQRTRLRGGLIALGLGYRWRRGSYTKRGWPLVEGVAISALLAGGTGCLSGPEQDLSVPGCARSARLEWGRDKDPRSGGTGPGATPGPMGARRIGAGRGRFDGDCYVDVNGIVNQEKVL